MQNLRLRMCGFSTLRFGAKGLRLRTWSFPDIRVPSFLIQEVATLWAAMLDIHKALILV